MRLRTTFERKSGILNDTFPHVHRNHLPFLKGAMEQSTFIRFFDGHQGHIC